uniref:BTB domain-containing protein n=1 Tax=Panagrolaimus sp. PS1159 TaxID=55785 RepID=A0AC35GSA9_9BILA
MSAAGGAQPKEDEKDGDLSSSLDESNDLPEIKFPFVLKWFMYECWARGAWCDGIPETRFYQIPGFPGLKYNLTLHFRRHLGESDTEESDGSGSDDSDGKWSDDDEIDDFYDALRVNLVPTNPKYKNYKVLAEWTDRIQCDKYKKRSLELSDTGIRYFDQIEFLYFPEAYKMAAFFHAEGTFTIKQIYTKDVEIESVPEEHRELLKDENGKDFTLVAGKKEIKIHKSVLTHNSPVFAAAANEKEWKEGAERKYAIPDFSHKIVQIAVDVIYGQAYAEALTKEEYISLFQFADKYQMDELKKAVKESTILTPHNICEYLNLCHSKKCEELVKCEELLDYCLENMLIFSQNGYAIYDKGLLNPEVKLLYADRAMKEPLKHVKTPKNNYYSFLDEREKPRDWTETDAVGCACSDLN